MGTGSTPTTTKGGAAALEWMGAVERIIYELTGNSYRAFDFHAQPQLSGFYPSNPRKRDGLPMLLVASQNCAERDIASNIGIIEPDDIENAFARMLTGDVSYRLCGEGPCGYGPDQRLWMAVQGPRRCLRSSTPEP